VARQLDGRSASSKEERLRRLMGLVVMAALALALTSAPMGAEAQPELDVNRDPVIRYPTPVVKRAAIDPITDPRPGHAHKHVFTCNPAVDADSTAESLRASGETCGGTDWASQSYWFPEVYENGKRVPVDKASVYYLGLGNQRTLDDMPFGAQLIGNKDNGLVRYACGQDAIERPGDATVPPKYCPASKFFRVRVDFPDCWDGSGLTPENFRYYGEQPCPAEYPRQIPDSLIAITYKNGNGMHPRELKASAGSGEREPIGRFMHADAFEAFQPKFLQELDRCIRDVPDHSVAPPGCKFFGS